MNASLHMRLFLLISLLLVQAGCSSGRVLEMGRDTYTVSHTDHWGNLGDARNDAIEIGVSKCASMNKKFLFVSDSHSRQGMNLSISLVFRCLSENDADYVRPNIEKAPDVVIKNAH